MSRLVLAGLSLLCAAHPLDAADLVEENGFRVPEGFAVQLYVDDTFAHDISCLTIDPQGRVVVSGPGYIKTLMPDEEAPWHSPKAKRAVTFSSLPKSGAQGLCFVGSDLFASGDGAVWKFRDADGDGVADGAPEKFIDGLKAGGEHGVHAIVQGPDGWLYIIGGDGSGITDKLNTIPAATIKKSLGGAILRVSLDGKQREVIAHGFRNPYGFCFNALGSIFAWDSDGERVEHLPGYRPCSLFDVRRTRHHGWVNSTPGNPISLPWHWPDVVNPLIEVGRGSPTGVVCYRHRQFPEEWQDGVFFACWTFGRVYFCKPERMMEWRTTEEEDAAGKPPLPTLTGPGYSAEKQVFLESVGNQGFAPSALAIGRDGALYISSGGRGTKGSVYRVVHKTNEIHGEAEDEVEQVLGADQPDTAWSRKEWVEQARALGAKAFEDWLMREEVGLSPAMDIRALEILTELFGGVRREIATHISSKLVRDAERMNEGRELLARLAWAAERNPTLTSEKERNDNFWGPATEAGRQGHRAAMEALTVENGTLQRKGESDESPDVPAAVTQEMRRGRNMGDPNNAPLICFRMLIAQLGDFVIGREMKWTDGYVVANPPKIRAEVERHAYWWSKNKNEAAHFEYARLVAMTQAEPEGFWETLPQKWTKDSEVRDDLHYLFVAARRSKAHEKVQPIADAWLRLHHKLRERGKSPSRAWPQMVGDAFEAMLKQSPALAEAIVTSPFFTLPEHSLFLEKLEGDVQRKAVFKLAAATREWSPELVKLAGEVVERSTTKLKAEEKAEISAGPNMILWGLAAKDKELMDLVGRLRELTGNSSLRDSVFVALPEWGFHFHGGIADRGLDSYQPAVITKSLNAEQNNFLFQCGTLTNEQQKAFRRYTAERCVRLLKAARRFSGQPAQAALVGRLHRACWTIVTPKERDESKPGDPLPPISEIEAAFRKMFPEEAKSLDNPLVANLDQELVRWSKLDVSKGDAANGKLIYEQRQCARCHSGNARMGPDLKGAAQRWSVEDIFLHISDPNRSISPAWKGERFVLKNDQEFTGAAVYDSPAGMLVQISPDETVRITGAELKERTPSSTSLMPPGLLAGLTDAELADLHAWLRTMK